MGKLIDSYLEAEAIDVNTSLQQVTSLAATVPEIARPEHDELYKAINIYLQEHPDLTKAGKKLLCYMLDSKELSTEMQMEVVRNERLPVSSLLQSREN
ncbi:OLC1v1021075C1 [Oldenlandia corymbosa var. corymbosa]|uniref:OLC1v1021075C1 n=1 Tax=Oldenlandia corymbosa var. corymbosa TaxID=529605 RepID=A0AAV1BUV2_OLDCO|nr:OLC1v1021075C1 [Oldenlandia corymbosa var. corymbosa]